MGSLGRGLLFYYYVTLMIQNDDRTTSSSTTLLKSVVNIVGRIMLNIHDAFSGVHVQRLS